MQKPIKGSTGISKKSVKNRWESLTKDSLRGTRGCWEMLKMTKYLDFFGIPGALRNSASQPSAPQPLRTSQPLSSQPLSSFAFSERAWQKFHRGRCRPRRKTKLLCTPRSGFWKTRVPPDNFFAFDCEPQTNVPTA